jgi:hypothetical protein
MNVETGAEAAQFPEKEYINGIAVAVQLRTKRIRKRIKGMMIWDFYCDNYPSSLALAKIH